MLTVGGLFSGIGGWELGLERAGMRIAWHCEADEFCRRVLDLRWPEVPCYDDVRALVADTASLGGKVEPGLDDRRRSLVGTVAGAGGRAGGGGASTRVQVGGRSEVASGAGDAGEPLPVPVPYVDVLCGGFPCQDISVAGKGAGINGSRSGLWREFDRLVGELRPRYVLVENVAALASRGLNVVLADLAARGFDAEWDCLPASAFGAPHRRDRLWLVAYPAQLHGNGSGDHALGGGASAHPLSEPRNGGCDADVAYAERPRLERAAGGRLSGTGRSSEFATGRDWWCAEPDVGRVAHGVPARVDRLRSLGNALVPQISEWIGRRILEWEGA